MQHFYQFIRITIFHAFFHASISRKNSTLIFGELVKSVVGLKAPKCTKEDLRMPVYLPEMFTLDINLSSALELLEILK